MSVGNVLVTLWNIPGGNNMIKGHLMTGECFDSDSTLNVMEIALKTCQLLPYPSEAYNIPFLLLATSKVSHPSPAE